MVVFVTQRIKDIRQPRGRYLPIKLFSVENLDNHRVLHPMKSVSSGVVGDLCSLPYSVYERHLC